MNKFSLQHMFLCAGIVLMPVLGYAQIAVNEELSAIDGTQANSATTTLSDVAQQQAATPNTIDAVIDNVVNDKTADDEAVLGDAPRAEVAVEEEVPAAELADDPMEPQKFAVLGTLDKVTGRTAILNVPVDKTVAVGPLFLQVKACQKASAFANQPENGAFVQVWQSDNMGDTSKDTKGTSWVFSGWMFSSSPALSAMDHPVYDVWVIDCKNAVKAAQPAPDDPKPKSGDPS
jgi:hypothetical protein